MEVTLILNSFPIHTSIENSEGALLVLFRFVRYNLKKVNLTESLS